MDTNGFLDLKMLSIIMHYSPERLDVAAQLLLSVIGQIEVKAGCRSCWVGRSVGEEGGVDYQELWDLEKAFRRHVRSAEFQRVLAAMDLCDEEPRVMIGTLRAKCGIEFLSQLRGCSMPKALELERDNDYGS
jgi:quinol monooxygenase YgiN